MFKLISDKWDGNIKLLPKKVWELPLIKIINLDLKKIPADILLGLIKSNIKKIEGGL